MWLTRNFYSRAVERKGQSMTEYALILAAVGVVAFLTYQTLGANIGSLLTSVIGLLIPAPSA